MGALCTCGTGILPVCSQRPAVCMARKHRAPAACLEVRSSLGDTTLARHRIEASTQSARHVGARSHEDLLNHPRTLNPPVAGFPSARVATITTPTEQPSCRSSVPFAVVFVSHMAISTTPLVCQLPAGVGIEARRGCGMIATESSPVSPPSRRWVAGGL
jgi:hypothetical protein